MSSGEPEIWTAGGGGGGGGGGGRGYSAGSDYSGYGIGALPFQERILVPRPWQSAEAKNEDSDNDDDDTNAGSSGKKGDSGKPKSGDKRGGYKCGRCGQPKKGHVCTNKPRLKTAFVETAEAWAQAECDPEMVLRSLDTKAQGFPESYGLTFRWAPAGAMPAYYQPQPPQAMQAPAPGPHGAPPQQVYYVPAPGAAPQPAPQGVMYYAAAPAPGYAPPPPQPQQGQQQQQQPPQQQQQQQQQGGGYY